MKINAQVKLVKFSQAIQFDKSAQTMIREPNSVDVRSGKKAFTIIEQEDGCIVIRSETCLVKVNPANIAYIEYAIETEEVVKASKSSK